MSKFHKNHRLNPIWYDKLNIASPGKNILFLNDLFSDHIQNLCTYSICRNTVCKKLVSRWKGIEEYRSFIHLFQNEPRFPQGTKSKNTYLFFSDWVSRLVLTDLKRVVLVGKISEIFVCYVCAAWIFRLYSYLHAC